MKNKHMYALLDDSYTTIHVSFSEVHIPNDKTTDWTVDQGLLRAPMHLQQIGRGQREQTYCYKVPKAWNVQAGDVVVVDSPKVGLKLANVVIVDASPQIDVDASFDYKWAVAKIDLNEYSNLINKEARFADTMLQVERTKQRESLVSSFMDSLPEGSEARKLFEATTASLAAPTPPPAPWDGKPAPASTASMASEEESE